MRLAIDLRRGIDRGAVKSLGQRHVHQRDESNLAEHRTIARAAVEARSQAPRSRNQSWAARRFALRKCMETAFQCGAAQQLESLQICKQRFVARCAHFHLRDVGIPPLELCPRTGRRRV